MQASGTSSSRPGTAEQQPNGGGGGGGGGISKRRRPDLGDDSNDWGGGADSMDSFYADSFDEEVQVRREGVRRRERDNFILDIDE